MAMRRKERQVTDDGIINSIIMECDCCRLGFIDEEGVYIVPMSFGFETKEKSGRIFYFHGASEGRKASCLKHCIDACIPISFELDCGHGIKRAETACGHSAYYKSVMGRGNAAYINDNSEKARALNLIMEHEAGKGGWDFPAAMLSHTAVFSLAVTQICCKANEAK